MEASSKPATNAEPTPAEPHTKAVSGVTLAFLFGTLYLLWAGDFRMAGMCGAVPILRTLERLLKGIAWLAPIRSLARGAWILFASVFGAVVGMALLTGLGYVAVWIAPSSQSAYWLRYAFENKVSYGDITVTEIPHGCDFLDSPLGSKGCHYDAVVSTVRVSRSREGQPVVSSDEGKTWSPIDSTNGAVRPSVVVTWVKVSH